jgi:hypothetical protein
VTYNSARLRRTADDAVPGHPSLVESLNPNSGTAGSERQDKSLFALLLEIESQLRKAARDEAGTQIETRKIPTVQNRRATRTASDFRLPR